MVDYLNGREPAVQLLSSLADQGVAISIVTYAELYEGIQQSSRRAEREQQLKEVTATLDVLPIDLEVAHHFGQIRADLRRRGQPIPDLDVLIAATALRNDLTLITRDAHFRRVPGIRLQAQS
jgi:predicted nucleic acid-binding protein